jgi:hypothetical protein
MRKPRGIAPNPQEWGRVGWEYPSFPQIIKNLKFLKHPQLL